MRKVFILGNNQPGASAILAKAISKVLEKGNPQKKGGFEQKLPIIPKATIISDSEPVLPVEGLQEMQRIHTKTKKRKKRKGRRKNYGSSKYYFGK